MVFGISPSLFIKTGSAVFGMYGAQMLFVPKMIHEDNFESPANECAAARARAVGCPRRAAQRDAAHAVGRGDPRRAWHPLAAEFSNPLATAEELWLRSVRARR